MNDDVGFRVEHYCEALNAIKHLITDNEDAAYQVNIQLEDFYRESRRIEWSVKENRFRIKS